MPRLALAAAPIPRRTLLKGLGAVSIGLPLLEEMTFAASAEAAVPVRAFNLFFGLGIPAPLQAEATADGTLAGVLEPLAPLADKLLVLKNVDQVRCDESGINAHFDGASGAFTAEPPDGEAKAGGPSIDQVVLNQHYPAGLPDGVVPTLAAGTYFRRSRVSRYVHSYRADGTVAAQMQERPRDLFDRVFGTVRDGGGTDGLSGEDARRRRLRRSVLDAVVAQYRHFSGARSPLGAASRTRIADHLERVREYERRAHALPDPAAPGGGPADGVPRPPRSRIAHGGAADPGGEGIDMPLEDLVNEWRLTSDLYALAVQTDRVRFGSLTYLAAGERLRIKGDYEYDGRRVFRFDDERQLGASGSKGCSHEWWHKFNPKRRNEELRAHAHLTMREVAHFLAALDTPECRESNGRTILENSLVTVSTESGDGRHSDVKRELSGVFHAVTGANGRFKTGEVLDVGAEGVDLYNTLLTGMGCDRKLGPADRDGSSVDAVRA